VTSRERLQNDVANGRHSLRQVDPESRRRTGSCAAGKCLAARASWRNTETRRFGYGVSVCPMRLLNLLLAAAILTYRPSARARVNSGILGESARPR
jgi:hypothetical protein